MKDRKDEMPGSARRPPAGIDPNSEIGAKLRALYGSVEGEGIPHKFLDLLEKLDDAERNASVDGHSDE